MTIKDLMTFLSKFPIDEDTEIYFGKEEGIEGDGNIIYSLYNIEDIKYHYIAYSCRSSLPSVNNKMTNVIVIEGE